MFYSSINTDPVRFETIFDLVSLDLCAGSEGAMNLVDPAPGALRAAVRSAMETPGYSSTDQGGRLALVARAFDSFPEAYRDRFVSWGQREFQYEPGQDHGVFFWRQILLHASQEPDRKTWMSRAAVALSARLEAAPTPDRTPTTEWDIACLAAHRARHGDTPMASPVEFVIATLSHVAFARSWEEALRTEPDRAAALAQALSWARRRAPILELPEELLTDPRTWPALLTSWD
jgi:hypothetical protein